jgi:hypothetical protein
MEEGPHNTSVNYLKQLSNPTEISFSTNGNPVQNTSETSEKYKVNHSTNMSDFNQQLKTTASNYISDRNVLSLGSTIPVPQVSNNIISHWKNALVPPIR